jgi:F-actin capping protein alpha subunit
VYYDPAKKVKFSFNPVTLEARIEETNVDWETQFLQPNVVQLRDEIVSAMNSYLGRQFRKGTTEFAVYAQGDGSELRVEISCHNFNFKSYWGGEWISTWIIDLASGGNISGHIKVHNHYFE